MVSSDRKATYINPPKKSEKSASPDNFFILKYTGFSIEREVYESGCVYFITYFFSTEPSS